MFMKKAPDTVPLATGPGVTVALGVALAMTLLIGIYPEPFIMMAREAVRPFFS
jgi:NADH:ubiquinone oxidoreductase subunit 2 (subunit N)